MTLEELTAVLSNVMANNVELGGVLKLDLGDDGVIVLDGTRSPGTVSNEDRDAACTVVVSLDDLSAIFTGELDAMAAFFQNRLRMEGDTSVASKLGRSSETTAGPPLADGDASLPWRLRVLGLATEGG